MPEQPFPGATFAQIMKRARRSALRRRAFLACARCKRKRLRCSDYRPCARCSEAEMGCEPLQRRPPYIRRVVRPVAASSPWENYPNAGQDWRWELEEGPGASDPFRFDEFWLLFCPPCSVDELLMEAYHGVHAPNPR